MKDTKSNLLLIIIMTLVALNLFNTKKIRTNVEEYNLKIDSIQKEIDSISIINSELDSKIESLHSDIELIDGSINRVQNNITVIKQNTNEKVRTITLFGDDELEQFFTDWARQYKDSVN